MNRSASAVSTTRTSQPCLVSRLVSSAALYAAIEPATPNTIFLPLLIYVEAVTILELRRLRPRRPQLLCFHNCQHAPQVFLDAGAEKQVIKVFPLGDLDRKSTRLNSS